MSDVLRQPWLLEVWDEKHLESSMIRDADKLRLFQMDGFVGSEKKVHQKFFCMIAYGENQKRQ